jgi:hypothetical protein
VSYRIREDAVDAAGRELSDHRPIQVDWIFDTDPKGRAAPPLKTETQPGRQQSATGPMRRLPYCNID